MTFHFGTFKRRIFRSSKSKKPYAGVVRAHVQFKHARDSGVDRCATELDLKPHSNDEDKNTVCDRLLACLGLSSLPHHIHVCLCCSNLICTCTKATMSVIHIANVSLSTVSTTRATVNYNESTNQGCFDGCCVWDIMCDVSVFH